MKLLALTLLAIVGVASSTTPTLAGPANVDSIFSTKEILDESTLETKAFFEAAQAGEFKLNRQRARWYQANMAGSARNLSELALQAGKSWDEIHAFADLILGSLCVTENWDRLKERVVNGYQQYLSSPYTRVELSPALVSNPSSGEIRPGVFRSPDERFENLKEYSFDPHDLEVDSKVGKSFSRVAEE